MSNQEDKKDKAKEYGLTAAKVGVGVIPSIVAPNNPGALILGAALSEGFGLLVSKINNHREEKARKAYSLLAANSRLEAEDFIRKTEEPGFNALLQHGIWQAAEAMTEERIEHIVNILTVGLEGKHEEAWAKKFLKELHDLDDIELALFFSMTEPLHTRTLYTFDVSEYSSLKDAIIGQFPEGTLALPKIEGDDIIDTAFDKLIRMDLIEQDHINQMAYPNGDFPIRYLPTRYGRIFSFYIRGKKRTEAHN